MAPSAALASSSSTTPNGTGEARTVATAAPAPSTAQAQAQQQQPQRAGTRSPTDGSATGKKSPNKYVTVQPSQALSGPGHGGHHEAAANILSSLRNGVPPKIFVKKEPGSPGPPTSRHRPRKLDLTRKDSSASTSRNTGPLTSRESGGLGIQDVGLACLSPGFMTQDPGMREQVQRSISVREQQRQIIESRLQQTAKPGDAPDSAKEMPGPASFGGMKTPSGRRKAPPGLSIVAPSHEQFANERVIQSAPLNQTFTGMNRGGHPLSRHIQNYPSNLSHSSHIHHVPANQTANRLPPISDVFASEGLGQRRENDGRDSAREPPRTAFFTNESGHSSHSNTRPSFPSPGHTSAQPQSARPREFRSAEEVQQELAGGRPELLPKLVHYGSNSHGQQPPTPPSPVQNQGPRTGGFPREDGARPGGFPREFPMPSREENFRPQQATSRRRGRDEYEEGVSPPLGPGPNSQHARRHGPSWEGREHEEEQRRKKEEFMGLCARAWDLFHS